MLKMRWHGHSCFEISNELTLVTDPHDGKSIGIPQPLVKADVVLVSHQHYDHNKVHIVKKENTEVVEGIGEKIVKGVSIKGFRSFHDEFEGRKRGKNTIFKFLFEGMKFCHLGDLGHQLDDETAKEIGQVDILFIPIGGNFTIDARKAMKVCEKIEPKVIIPMHYKIGGLSLPIEGVDRFLDIAKEKYEISHVSNEIDMEKEDLPEKTEVWVFNL